MVGEFGEVCSGLRRGDLTGATGELSLSLVSSVSLACGSGAFGFEDSISCVGKSEPAAGFESTRTRIPPFQVSIEIGLKRES